MAIRNGQFFLPENILQVLKSKLEKNSFVNAGILKDFCFQIRLYLDWYMPLQDELDIGRNLSKIEVPQLYIV